MAGAELLRVAVLLVVPGLAACGPAFSSSAAPPPGAGGAGTSTGTSTGAGGAGTSTGAGGAATATGGGGGCDPASPDHACGDRCDQDVVSCGATVHCGGCPGARYCIDGACGCPKATVGIARHLLAGQHCFDSSLKPELCKQLGYAQLESSAVFFAYASPDAAPGLVPLTFCGPSFMASSEPVLVLSAACPPGHAPGVPIGFVAPPANSASCGTLALHPWSRATPADHVYTTSTSGDEITNLQNGGYVDQGAIALVSTTGD